MPGCISEGETREEALANIKEAIEGYLEAFPEEIKQVKKEERVCGDVCLKNYP